MTEVGEGWRRVEQGRRIRIDSGSPWEPVAGYARAVRVGDRVYVSGTTALGPGGVVVARGDAGAQARHVLDKIERALQELGASLADVVRTNVYVRRIQDAEAVVRAHGERFRDIRPASTLVEARLIGEDLLVEIEAEAVIGAGAP